MSNTALGLTALLLVIPIIISYKEGLHIIKDLIVATYLSYGQFFNARHQLVARNTDVKSES
ncbi:TPA: hypothetical protein O6F20_001805 [Staphylococcus aureus]|nr:hypothetical protein [Staphylococcus aureus]HCZ3982661.1 hypothetical protein [Staphylococcus aureus]HCZ4001685.1 hypothetical protein [Staphylococcus aureus]HDB1693545.1 hypothetical protein [Staphylococcus aureus]HDB2400288.1 hypothetical protein [Staphylococcus aureus]